MKITRKDFLRLSGLSLLAVTGKKVVRAVTGSADAQKTVPNAKRWGMVIDLQKCREKEGCSLCIKACNQAHNIPQFHDQAHEVKWIWKQPYETVFPFAETDYTRQAYTGRPIPLLCNHCTNPPCVRVCPTHATWKREDGIVMMDWHRCIGCRYCMAACPYGSRSFNWQDPRPAIAAINADFPTRTKGVVEKCNFCEERLARNQAPVCVEACKSIGAIAFGDLNDPESEPRRILRSRFAIQREPELGTGPSVYYLV